MHDMGPRLDDVRQGPKVSQLRVDRWDPRLVVEKIDRGHPVAGPEEMRQGFQLVSAQTSLLVQGGQPGRIVLGVSGIAERPPANGQLEPVGRNRVKVPASFDPYRLPHDRDRYGTARVGGNVANEPAGLDVVARNESQDRKSVVEGKRGRRDVRQLK